MLLNHMLINKDEYVSGVFLQVHTLHPFLNPVFVMPQLSNPERFSSERCNCGSLSQTFCQLAAVC